MQTQLSPALLDTAAGREGESILRSCVHCGFCNATCPTYQLLGDELDGPRGRIYLIKQMLEGGQAGRSTQVHLDRCLTCLACQTTCPSGVEYGKLLSIGRALVEQQVERPAVERLTRWLLQEGLASAWFAPLFRVARALRGLLPEVLRRKIPRAVPRPKSPSAATSSDGSPAAGSLRGNSRAPSSTAATPERKVLLLAGCVQPAMLPNINDATARVLSAAGIQMLIADGAGCCGALREHLSDQEGGLADARRNIDAWWPLVSAGGVEAIVMNASACGLAVKHYAEALEHDPRYADKAARISALARDLSELLPELVPVIKDRVRAAAPGHLVFHAPCTLQHGQRLRGGVEAQLAALGFDIQAAVTDGHLCCGSAGTYSVLQPAIATQLRDRKIGNLADSKPDCIVSANVGCILHLQGGTEIPVRHWIEVLDEALAG